MDKLPSLGKSLGEAIRGFKKGLHEEPSEEKKQ
ncbi:MAG: twin-arginine translocase TatA/TatE family subunit [Nitrospirota bacterium]